jgi:uncharacterized protein (DUF3084 family)
MFKDLIRRVSDEVILAVSFRAREIGIYDPVALATADSIVADATRVLMCIGPWVETHG